LQQNGKGVIQNVNQDGKHGLQQLADSYRDQDQRYDDQVIEARAGRASRYGPVVAEFIVQSLTPGLAAGTKPSRIEKQKRAIKLLALADEVIE
jgi:hypothetical protein